MEKYHLSDLKSLLKDDGKPGTSSASESLFFDSKTLQVYGRLDLVINGLLPFSVVDNPVFVRFVRYKDISRNTLSKYMSLLTRAVKRK